MSVRLPARFKMFGPTSIFRAISIKHLSFNTSDYAKTRDWFMDLFGMQWTFDDGKQAAVTFGNPTRDIYCRQRGNKPYVDHWAIAIADFDNIKTRETLEQWGLQPRWDGENAFHTPDWDGVNTQAARAEGCFPGSAVGGEFKLPHATKEPHIPPEDKQRRPAPWRATAINHVSYGVPNYARTRDFYMDLYGMRLAFEDGKQCALAFGGPPEDAIYIHTREDGPVFDRIAISIANFDLDKVEADIKRLGLDYKPAGDSAWELSGPDGFPIEVCAQSGVYPGAAYDPYHQTRKK